MSKKNQIANVVNAYVVAPNGTAVSLSYDDAMNNAEKYKISAETVGYLRNIHDGIKEQTNGTFKIGYNLAQLCKGDNPEYKRMGYNSIRDVITDMFDINEVTGYKWADTAAKFVTYDTKTGQYHSIFATEFDGKTYDFTMSQLSEMRFPLDKKTGEEIIDLTIWRTMFDARVINTATTTKGIRKIQNILVALAKNGKELSVANVHDLYEKSERLNMTPEKALPYKENAQATQPTQGTPQGTPQGTAQTAQPTEGTAQMQGLSIRQAIEDGSINSLISETIHNAMIPFEEYMNIYKSEIVRCAIIGMINAYLQTVPESIANDSTEQPEQPEQPTKPEKAKTAKPKTVKRDKTVSTRKAKSSK